MNFTFPPPDKPWSTNQDRTLNKYTRAVRIAAWKGVTMAAYGSWCARQKRDRALSPSLVRVHIPFTHKRRRDPHNYCGTVVKAIIDGLVKAGAWPDDTPNYVEHLSPVLYKGDEVKIELFPLMPARLPCEHDRYEKHPKPDTEPTILLGSAGMTFASKDWCDGYTEITW